jgi:hypothetical protein
MESMSSMAVPGDTPNLGEVRDKIERRYANAMGRQELASGGVEARMLEVQKATIDTAANSRLDAIRASLHAGPPQVTAGAQPPSLEKADTPAIEQSAASSAEQAPAAAPQEAAPDA